MMTREELEPLDDEGMAAWDSQDPEALVKLLSDDFVWYDRTLPEPIRDKDGARQYVAGWHAAFPDMRTRQVTRVIGDDTVAAEIEFSGTNSGPIQMGATLMPPTNRKVTGRGAYTARAKDGKIVEFRTHPDVAGLMGQLGLLPQPSERRSKAA